MTTFQFGCQKHTKYQFQTWLTLTATHIIPVVYHETICQVATDVLCFFWRKKNFLILLIFRPQVTTHVSEYIFIYSLNNMYICQTHWLNDISFPCTGWDLCSCEKWRLADWQTTKSTSVNDCYVLWLNRSELTSVSSREIFGKAATLRCLRLTTLTTSSRICCSNWGFSTFTYHRHVTKKTRLFRFILRSDNCFEWQ